MLYVGIAFEHDFEVTSGTKCRCQTSSGTCLLLQDKIYETNLQ